MATELLRGNYNKDVMHRSFMLWPTVAAQFRRIWSCLSKQTGVDNPVIIEIGTFRGLSTVALARFGIVYTYDIVAQPECKRIWRAEGVAHRIQQSVVQAAVQRSDLPESFQAAFIDGEHTHSAVTSDFEAVKECGLVVFDDVTVQFPGVVRFVNELKFNEPGTVLHYGRFAVWWRADKC